VLFPVLVVDLATWLLVALGVFVVLAVLRWLDWMPVIP
jgi:hypothetical protein